MDRVDSVAYSFENSDVSTKALLSGYIKDKIVGRARCELQKHGRICTWSQIRGILKNSFGEKSSVNELIDSIRTARVTTTIEDYYLVINSFLSRINNKLLLENHQNGQEMIESNNRIALDAFKNNLPEPTKFIILNRNPSSLNEAYKIITEINHQSYGPNLPVDQFRNRGRAQLSYQHNNPHTRTNNTNNYFTRSVQMRHDGYYTPRQNNCPQNFQTRQNNNYTHNGQTRQVNNYTPSGRQSNSYVQSNQS